MPPKTDEDYGLSTPHETGEISAPALAYRPANPKEYRPAIGLIGCGGITEQHLTAYRNAGYRVAILCDVAIDRAEKQRKKFYPDAKVVTDYRRVLEEPGVEVVDVATHPEERVAILDESLSAGKHILSQKPFVTDVDVGQRLATRADELGLKLAVNQNGRWAPHFCYARQLVSQGFLGDVSKVEITVHWDHNWVAETVFDRIHHLVLYDFAIHWFDMTAVVFGDREATKVYASVEHSQGQRATPPLLAQATVEFPGGQATLAFNGNCPYGQEDRTVVVGTRGRLLSSGPSLQDQTITLDRPEGHSHFKPEGHWFPDGFHGAMGELLCAIEEDREPSHSARNNLKSLALCFAAVESAETGEPQVPGKVRSIGV